jgi:uncharacterized membrane protein
MPYPAGQPSGFQPPQIPPQPMIPPQKRPGLDGGAMSRQLESQRQAGLRQRQTNIYRQRNHFTPLKFSPQPQPQEPPNLLSDGGSGFDGGAYSRYLESQRQQDLRYRGGMQ